MSIFSVDNCWYDDDMIRGNAVERRALKDSTKSFTLTSVWADKTYALFTSADSYENAISYAGFGGSVSMDYTREINRESQASGIFYQSSDQNTRYPRLHGRH
eukprot:Nk52_evm15s157 gene=Nk52_evmTU15s157